MSPRAACRLATLDYDVYDYPAGKIDWMAHGLPMDGEAARRPTALTLVRDDVATCTLDDRVADVARVIGASEYGFALVLASDRVVLGRVRGSRLADTEPDARAEVLMEPGPSTIRPHLRVEDLAGRLATTTGATLIVTDPEGVLIGVVRRGDVERAI